MCMIDVCLESIFGNTLGSQPKQRSRHRTYDIRHPEDFQHRPSISLSRVLERSWKCLASERTSHCLVMPIVSKLSSSRGLPTVTSHGPNSDKN
jgi:hypothetical protein